uniref:Uncharacterized protein n=1 Tax=Plectus sambesii TaxID=2011161 RepID=A0A914VQ42_9BILA
MEGNAWRVDRRQFVQSTPSQVVQVKRYRLSPTTNTRVAAARAARLVHSLVSLPLPLLPSPERFGYHQSNAAIVYLHRLLQLPKPPTPACYGFRSQE